MFDIGMFEMTLIAVIALLILGPERMPEAAKAAGHWVGKARRMITGIKEDVASQMSLDELTELRQLRDDLSSAKTQLGKFQNQASGALNQKVSLQATAAESLPTAKSNDSKSKKNKKTEQA